MENSSGRTEANNRKGTEDRQEENDSNIIFTENAKTSQKEGKSTTCVNSLKYATDISASRVLKVKTSDSMEKTFSTKCNSEKDRKLLTNLCNNPAILTNLNIG